MSRPAPAIAVGVQTQRSRWPCRPAAAATSAPTADRRGSPFTTDLHRLCRDTVGVQTQRSRWPDRRGRDKRADRGSQGISFYKARLRPRDRRLRSLRAYHQSNSTHRREPPRARAHRITRGCPAGGTIGRVRAIATPAWPVPRDRQL